jgi:hypothetical protein
VVSDDQHVYISGGGSTQTATNIGQGSGIYSGTISDEFKLRSISGVSGIVVTGYENNTIVASGQTGTFYDKSNPSGFITGVDSGHLITGASNIGSGSGIYSGKLDNDLKFKTLIAGPNIALSGDSEHIMISGTAGGGGSDLIVVDETTTLSTAATKLTFVGAGVSATEPTADEITVTVAGGVVNWKTPPPAHKNSAGTEGEMSFDDTYYYICIQENEWRRVAISEW